ncbi:hypothetical protein Dimus_006454 [Dionaea muscipula]
MSGGGGDGDHQPRLPPPPRTPINGGEFLLRLVQNHRQPVAPFPSLPHQQSHNLSLDPAVAAVGPSLPSHRDDPSLRPPLLPPSFPHPNRSSSPPYPPNFFLHGFPSNPTRPHHLHPRPPNSGSPQQQFNLQTNHHQQQGPSKFMFGTVPFHVPNEGLMRSDFLDREILPSNTKLNSQESRELGIVDPVRGIDRLAEMEAGGQRRGHRRPEMRGESHFSEFVGKDVNRMKGFDQNVGRDFSSSSSRYDSHEPHGSGISDPDWGNHLLQLRRYETSETRWSPAPGLKPAIRNKEFGHNAGSERFGNSCNDLNHEGLSSSNSNHGKGMRFVDGNKDSDSSFTGSHEVAPSGQLHLPGPPAGSTLRSESASSIKKSLMNMDSEVDDDGVGSRHSIPDSVGDNDHANRLGEDDIGDLSNQLAESTMDGAESNGKHSGKKNHYRDKDFRSDTRGQRLLSQRMRYMRRFIDCRVDIGRLNAPFLAIYESLIPAKEEKAKQKQLLASLEKLVNKEWPDAKLYLYGSCANSFGVSNSDIDVCLAIDDQDINKSEFLLKLAEILESDNLQDVQALTRARVPIVKLKDPVTGISCDICINNILAVVNTKLLRDYAEIDVRLRQLAFIVKHWAKSRGVNETYQGTLSSYAYVLMCIHFLQHRRPAILPCLQGMPATYSVTIEGVEYEYFDQVEKLRDFGVHNREGIAQLVWGFFRYWAYHHDYTNSVISVRTGTIFSKQVKDWTRRIGNDRHLICIEDPFETSHDLGRVVDKYSIRVLREEFERAAEIMQLDPNPCVTLFEPYIPS